jgi:hypothetical protein
VITTAVRWYFRYRLSAADVRDLLLEGIELAYPIHRGHLEATTGSGGGGCPPSPHERVRETAEAFTRLANSLTDAA